MEGVELKPDEQFKQIVDYPNYYISNQGRCWSNKTKQFIGSINKKTNCIVVRLRNEWKIQTFKVQQLVMKY